MGNLLALVLLLIVLAWNLRRLDVAVTDYQAAKQRLETARQDGRNQIAAAHREGQRRLVAARKTAGLL